ncbi:MAG: hypothetical protein NTX25_15345 [Proteobacteria bacterium]|nr:hypothetical protein [Pseudomonadota bacterium]
MTQSSSDLKTKTGHRKRSERKRFLNIIYFIDSNRTRTLKLSIRSSYLTVATLVLLISWSFFASLLLIQEHQLNHEQRVRSVELLTSIFNYQTRYDQVYEKAYPSETSPAVAIKQQNDHIETARVQTVEKDEGQKIRVEDSQKTKTPAPALPAGLAQAPKPSPSPSPSVLASTSVETMASSPKEKVISAPIEKTPALPDPPVIVENFSSAIEDQVLTARFALKNLKKGSKATGTVQALARFEEEGQDAIWLSTNIETNVEQQESADQDDPSSDHRFNIRFYKNKVFHFALPSEKSGVFPSPVRSSTASASFLL